MQLTVQQEAANKFTAQPCKILPGSGGGGEVLVEVQGTWRAHNSIPLLSQPLVILIP